MNSKLILHIDENHPLLIKGLESLGFENHIAYTTPLKEVIELLPKYSGVVIRSRFPIDKNFIDSATNLKFIARVGAGLENIDLACAQSKKIALIAAPEGNRNAVGEHVLGMLLGLMNKLREAHASIQKGAWLREDHRGFELEGKTIGIIGYGNTGKSFAKKLQGFKVEVICYDIKAGVGDQNAKQVSLEELQDRAKVISLHIPQATETNGMIDKNFIARIVEGLRSKKILGAGLDVLEYESSSFHSIFGNKNRPKALEYLLNAENVLISPHVAGWTFESHIKLAQTIVDKISVLNL
jgi:D-3-phosphoglycerate dehydrogenase